MGPAKSYEFLAHGKKSLAVILKSDLVDQTWLGDAIGVFTCLPVQQEGNAEADLVRGLRVAPRCLVLGVVHHAVNRIALGLHGGDEFYMLSVLLDGVSLEYSHEAIQAGNGLESFEADRKRVGM